MIACPLPRGMLGGKPTAQRRRSKDRNDAQPDFPLVALALGNFVIGVSILAPVGMLAELASGFGVSSARSDC